MGVVVLLLRSHWMRRLEIGVLLHYPPAPGS